MERPEPRTRRPESAQKVFSGVIFDVYQWEQEMFDGSKATFETLTRSDTVVMLPVTPEGEILTIDEQQPARAAKLTIPAGQIEKGEEVLAAAARELMEETGYEAQKFSLWMAYQPFTKIDWAIYVLIAHGCKKVADQKLDPGERITLRPVGIDQFVEEVLAGTIDMSPEIQREIWKAKVDPFMMEALRSRLVS